MSNKSQQKVPLKTAHTTLANAEIGVPYTILFCTAAGAAKTRFLEMGLTRGTTVTVLKRAPLGDPLELTLRGYTLCIRKRDAHHFIVAELHT